MNTDETELYNEHNWDSKCICIDCEEYRNEM